MVNNLFVPELKMLPPIKLIKSHPYGSNPKTFKAQLLFSSASHTR